MLYPSYYDYQRGRTPYTDLLPGTGAVGITISVDRGSVLSRASTSVWEAGKRTPPVTYWPAIMEFLSYCLPTSRLARWALRSGCTECTGGSPTERWRSS
jgi:hypothetical protein